MGSGLGDVEVSWRLRWFWALLVLSCLVLFGSTAKLWTGMSRGRAVLKLKVLKLSRRPERNCSRKGLDVQDRLCIIDYKFTSRETESGREQTSFASCEWKGACHRTGMDHFLKSGGGGELVSPCQLSYYVRRQDSFHLPVK